MWITILNAPLPIVSAAPYLRREPFIRVEQEVCGMAQRGGGRSEWERQQAAARREAERAAREAARREKEAEKLRKQQHIEKQQKLTENRTREISQRIARLDSILTDTLQRAPLGFDDLVVKPKIPLFDPGPLGIPESEPTWAEYDPEPPGLVGLLFGGAGRHGRAIERAEQEFQKALTAHKKRESQRNSALLKARREHAERVRKIEDKTQAENTKLKTRAVEFSQSRPEAVEWFVERILDRSTYPKGFPKKTQIAYRPQNRDVVIELELPPTSVIPDVRGYKYVKTRDAIDPVPRPPSEVKKRYAQLIARVALRTLHEVLSATPSDVVEAVVFNGRLTTTDPATGQTTRLHLLSVASERSNFEKLVLSKVDAVACLKRLNALVSPNPYDLEAIEPFIEFDLKRFRFTEDFDVVSNLDSRKNLLELSPTEFEHLIRDLFSSMGAEAWTTIPSKDGGVDAVATSKDIFFGGVCLIQAKRWSKLVGLDAVHALTGVMADHNATTGVLVTTSWFGRASEQFAQRNRVTLINGAELKHLIKKHLDIDVVPGVTPKHKPRASNNKQSGRPGPTQ
ncbi:restriction endonuclease [Nocardiopsis sp. LOL_012]|uniref:restriction endonuclease n=1 Tax=Nocardiopsis sp. LOL_012 TaxID=3345409 RepID=UPI003A8414AD